MSDFLIKDEVGPLGHHFFVSKTLRTADHLVDDPHLFNNFNIRCFPTSKIVDMTDNLRFYTGINFLIWIQKLQLRLYLTKFWNYIFIILKNK